MQQLLRRCFSGAGFSLPSPKALNAIVKEDLLSKESSSSIASIWTEHHAAKQDCIASTLSPTDHALLRQRGDATPYFVFPVHREQGLFTMLSQFQDQYILFTYLEAFKQNPQTAPPYLVVAMYDELLVSKQLSLVRGEIVNELDKSEATTLLDRFLGMYLDPTRYAMVEQFNNAPATLDFEAYLDKEASSPSSSYTTTE